MVTVPAPQGPHAKARTVSDLGTCRAQPFIVIRQLYAQFQLPIVYICDIQRRAILDCTYHSPYPVPYTTALRTIHHVQYVLASYVVR